MKREDVVNTAFSLLGLAVTLYITAPRKKAVMTVYVPNENIFELNPFGDVKYPSVKLQMAVVKKKGTDIKWIKYPCDDVCIAAVQQDKRAFSYIKNPSIRVQNAYADVLNS